jgi:hypothetical protein
MQGEGEEGEDGFEKMKSAKEKKKVRAADKLAHLICVHLLLICTWVEPW